MSVKIVVYGSLMQGMPLHGVLAKALLSQSAVYHGLAKFRGHLVMVPNEDYPGCTPGLEWVIGEVYSVSRAVLAELDKIEEFDPLAPETSEYIRGPVRVRYLDGSLGEEMVQVYWWNSELQNLEDSETLQILSGDYRREKVTQGKSGAWFLAYGSSLNPHHMQRKNIQIGQVRGGLIPNYRLQFSRKNTIGHSSPNLVFDPQVKTPILAYRVPADALGVLDQMKQSGRFRTVLPWINDQGQKIWGQVYLAPPDDWVAPEHAMPWPEEVENIRLGCEEWGISTAILERALRETKWDSHQKMVDDGRKLDLSRL